MSGQGIATREEVRQAAVRLRAWLERERFVGWDPHDALNSRVVNRLSFGRHRLKQAWVQALKSSPLNLRPLLRVAKGSNPKGMGLLLATYWRLARTAAGRDPAALAQVTYLARWLLEHAERGWSGPAWGYNFDWPNRAFYAPAGTPTIVNTAFVGLALLDLASTPEWEREAVGEGAALAAARWACRFVTDDLHVERPGNDEIWFSYTPGDRRLVHNANVLGATLLAATARRTGESTLMDLALRAARFTARRQRPAGEWPYGEGASDRWVDSFHTGYVLESLDAIQRLAGTREFEGAIERGYRFWKARLFLADGTPKYYAERTYPLDAHVAAEAILTFLTFSGRDAEALDRAWHLAGWLVGHFQDRAGYFHYQQRRAYRIRIPYIRWVQAWVFRSLAELDYHAHAATTS